MKMALEKINYTDSNDIPREVLTNRIMDEATFNIYLQMVEDFQDQDFEVDIIKYWTIDQQEKEKILQRDNQFIVNRVHSNYLTLHQDIDKLYNNRG